MKCKNIILLLFIDLILLSLTPLTPTYVKFVYDGDTILIHTGERVRYLGIDAPEIGRKGEQSEFMAFASKRYNGRLVRQARVRLEFDQTKRDRHGRLLAYVFLENGQMVNALLVEQGLALVMTKSPNLKYRRLLLRCQRSAMSKKLGLWQKPHLEEEPYYPGSLKSYRFHRPGCPFARKIHARNRVRFDSRRDAFWEGFSPCKGCRP